MLHGDRRPEVGSGLRFGPVLALMPPGFNLKAPSPIETVTKVRDDPGPLDFEKRVDAHRRDIIAIDSSAVPGFRCAQVPYSNNDMKNGTMKNPRSGRPPVVGDQYHGQHPDHPGVRDARAGAAPVAGVAPAAKETCRSRRATFFQDRSDKYDAGSGHRCELQNVSHRRSEGRLRDRPTPTVKTSKRREQGPRLRSQVR